MSGTISLVSVASRRVIMWWLVALAVAVLFFVLYVRASTPSEPPPDPPQSDSSPQKDDGLKPMTLLFATQTGNSQIYTEELESEARSYGFSPKLIDIEEYEVDQLQFEEFVVIITSTYGEGDPTDSAIEFTEWILEEEREDDTMLTELQFCIFGLGNRQYELFNHQAKVVAKRLQELGANMIMETGLGDDDGNIDDDWMNWKSEFWPKAGNHFGIGIDESTIQVPAFEGSFRVIIHDDDDDDDKESVIQLDEGVELANITENRELRNVKEEKTGDSTKHLEIDISDTGLSYRTADNLEVFGRNDYKVVGRICKSLGLKPGMLFSLKLLDPMKRKKLPVKGPVSVQEALLWSFDLTGSPKRKFLLNLSQYADDDKEREELEALGTGKGDFKEMFNKMFHDGDRLNIADILEKYPSIDVPLEHFLELLPRAQSRAYTIASSDLVHPESVHVTLSVVMDKLDDGRVWNGICSTYMMNLRPGKDQVRVTVRASTFRLPEPLDSAPVIMIGPGSGIAPMRAFIQEARHYSDSGGKLQEFILFFGCRNRDIDFLYKEELEAAVEDGILSQLIVAFSREQAQKVYVQHKVKEHAAELWPLVSEKNAFIYVCGGTDMGRDIREIMKSMFSECGGLSIEESQSYLHQMQESGRYVQELWG